MEWWYINLQKQRKLFKVNKIHLINKHLRKNDLQTWRTLIMGSLMLLISKLSSTSSSKCITKQIKRLITWRASLLGQKCPYHLGCLIMMMRILRSPCLLPLCAWCLFSSFAFNIFLFCNHFLIKKGLFCFCNFIFVLFFKWVLDLCTFDVIYLLIFPTFLIMSNRNKYNLNGNVVYSLSLWYEV